MRRGVFKKIQRLLHDRRGQTLTEYILILSLVALIAMKFRTEIKKQLDTAVQTVGGNINSVINDTSD